jgi:hypothetical protein
MIFIPKHLGAIAHNRLYVRPALRVSRRFSASRRPGLCNGYGLAMRLAVLWSTPTAHSTHSLPALVALPAGSAVAQSPYQDCQNIA